MNFEPDDIIKLLKANSQTPDWVVKAREYHKELKALIYGDEFTTLLLQIEHIESSKRAEARKKYSRPIQDLNERLLRLIDNVYTATGGSKEYKIESESKQKELLKAISHNRDNKSLEKWLQTFWSKDLYIVDPAGVTFLEYDAKKDITPYPTYKSIDRIRSYEAKGQNLEWIIFEPQKVKTIKKGMFQTSAKDIELVRFVDDTKDYTYKKDGNNYTLIDELSFLHPFGKVPGLVNSNIQRLGTEKRFSLIDNIIPLEREIARDQSVLSIFKFLKGNPTPIRPVVVCPSCRGIGKKGIEKCTDCNGKGHVLRNDITDEIQIPISLDKEEGYNLPAGIFTYMSPPLDIWNQYVTEVDRNENKASDTLWGTHKERIETQERTAFETFVDTQPVTTKLSEISEVGEFMEWQLTEWIANYIDQTKPKDKHISIISYGKMFIIEPPEAIMEKYRVNKKDNVSVVVLDRQLFEYITSKYKNNPQVLRMELVKKELDYYVHYSVDEVKEIFDFKEAQKKMLFTDWWETLDFNDVKGGKKEVESLKKKRDEWMTIEITRLNINQNTGTNE